MEDTLAYRNTNIFTNKIRNMACGCSFSKIHCIFFDLIVTYRDSQREKFVILRKFSQCFANRIRKIKHKGPAD